MAAARFMVRIVYEDTTRLLKRQSNVNRVEHNKKLHWYSSVIPGRLFRNIVERNPGFRLHLQSRPREGLFRYLSNLSGENVSGSQKDELKGLADDILRSKLQSDQKLNEENRQKKEDEAKAEASKRMMKWSFIAFGVTFVGAAVAILLEWGSPFKDEEGKVIQDEFSDMNIVKQYFLRTHREILHYDKLIKDPSREKLLPDPLTEPYYQPPYTLVLEMTGVLVHPDWSYSTGWRFKKRPGVDFFLQQVGPPLFEVVIYTSEQGFTAFPIIDSLDPNGHIMYRLFRDATRYSNGHHIKDLSCLNRDLSRVIMIDWNKESVGMNRENSLVLKRWRGEDNDRNLMELAMLLRTIATNEVEDVRNVLQFYSQFEDPVAAFRENQQRLAVENEQKQKESQQKSSSLARSWTGIITGRK